MREAVTTIKKNYAVLLRCPHRDQDTWVVLENRKETMEEILGMPWDFECTTHGVQHEMPVSASENGPPIGQPKAKKNTSDAMRASARVHLTVPVRVYGWVRSKGAFHEESTTSVINSGGCLVFLETKVDMGDMLFVVNRASNQEQQCRVAYVEEEGLGAKVGLAFKAPVERFWQMNQNRPRIAKTIEVLVKGFDRKGNPFTQTTFTIDISERGARLEGLGGIIGAGETIEIKNGWKKARYRVMWIGPPGTPEANQVGICCMEDNKNIWGASLPTPVKRKA
jgi:hypothetical protein